MNIKTLTLSAFCLLCSAGGFAQGRILTILDATPDVRSSGMGHTMLGNTGQMHLYSNPATMVFARQKFNVSLGTELFPDTEVGRLVQYNLAAGYKFHPHRAILAGMRRQSGLSIPTTEGEKINPYEVTFDLGYAFAVTSDIVVYASGTYAKSYMGTTAHGVALSVGATYQKDFSLGSLPSLLTVGARLLDAGKPVKYNNTKLPQSLPTSVVIGGDWAFRPSDKHRLTYALSARIFTPKDSNEFRLGTGVEYTYNNFLSARAGYQCAHKMANSFTMGLGVAYKGLNFNAAYSHSSAIYGEDTLLLGAGFTF